MGKLLLFLLVLLGIYLFRRALVRPAAPPPRGQEGAAPARPAAERMVECAHCGLHVPESEAVAGTLADAGRFFCSEAHRQAHAQAPRPGG